MMASIYAVPGRVTEGSEQPFAVWKIIALLLIGGGVLVETTRSSINVKTPTLGLTGGYHTIADAPFEWFSDGRLNPQVVS